MKEINSIEELQSFLSAASPVIVLKHSTRCPVSTWAYNQFEKFVSAHAAVPSAIVKVIESRPVSNQIAELTGIKHESPQAIVFKAGKAVWHGSHNELTAEKLAAAIGS